MNVPFSGNHQVPSLLYLWATIYASMNEATEYV